MVVIAAILGVTFYAVSRPEPSESEDAVPYIWSFPNDDIYELQHAEISMPKTGDSVSFVQHEDKNFYFDVDNGSIVDKNRWGGGIPLLLSGPRADRSLVQNATDAQLAEYGFTTPSLKIILTLKDSTIFNIELGDSTPSGQTYYIRLTELREIYTVDYSWYDVISRLVTEPPYPADNFVNEKLTVTPSEASVLQPITITAEMVNTGAVTGQYTVELKINGTVEATKAIELERNERITVAFTITKSLTGTYSINVAGKTAKLVVK